MQGLARPGGNLTGSSFFFPELNAKRIEMLKEALPDLKRVAVLMNDTNPGNVVTFEAMTQTARTVGIEVTPGNPGCRDRYRRSGPSTRLRAASSSRRVVNPSNRARTTPAPSTTKIHGSERRFHSSTVGENFWRDPAAQIS